VLTAGSLGGRLSQVHAVKLSANAAVLFPPASPLSGEEKMMAFTIFVGVVLLGLWAFHRIGAVLDARLARKELDERIAQLDQVVEDVSTTELRMRQRVERERPIGRLLAAVRDEPTVPLR
jgi:hypothetical protein